MWHIMYDVLYKPGHEFVELFLCSIHHMSSDNSGSEYHERKYLIRPNWWEIMNFQREILAKSLAKLQFAVRFSPFRASFIETFGRKMSKSLNISSENSPCMGMNFVIFTNIKMQTNTSIFPL